ncbi:MAG: hypothetical protein V8T90_10390 [Victivallales bacterium]|jgi:cell division cycle protein 123 homolog
MSDAKDVFRVQNYYPLFAHCSMPATFAFLRDPEIEALAKGEYAGKYADSAIRRISEAMRPFRGKHFVSTDFAAPTDSPRFLSSKRGSVVSASSAWISLAGSAKIRALAAAGDVQCVCVRGFRVFDIPREYRLFIRNGQLVAMSQRFLIRHFRRLVRRQEDYWNVALRFFDEIKSALPVDTLTVDIYITCNRKVIVLDLNPWGDPTDPLMFRDWNREITEPLGCLLVPPPCMISGDVNVSF